MRKKILLLILVGIGAYFLWLAPAEPAYIMQVKVVALKDLDDQGKRLITVRFEDGSEKAIETYVPFFYKVGYSAHVAVYERHVFPDVYRFVSDSR